MALLSRTRRITRATVLAVALLAAGPVLILALGSTSARGDWRNATHRPVGLAPEAAAHADAVVQVYAARTYGWRGAFAVHTWLAAKPRDADGYTRYEVIGWYARAGRSAVSISDYRAPDAEWYGAAPELLRDLRGAEAEAVLAKLEAAVSSYPHADEYTAWPGPNSNTFVAHLGREIPELRLTLPPTAIGKDYLPNNAIVARSPSGTGYQVSLGGLLRRHGRQRRRLRAERAGARHRLRLQGAGAEASRCGSRAGRLGWRCRHPLAEKSRMKLKMAEKSLFAVLLRSPWWVSLGIGIALGGAGWALFPEAYRIAGAGAGLPFVVIAAIAAWRALQSPSAKRVETTVQAVSAMSWPEFASAIEDAFRRDGHDVKRVESGPVDFEITKGGRTAVVGARRWKVARTGVEPLRALHTAGEAREASECIHIAIGEVTPSAREFAAKHRTRVLGGPTS